MGRGDDVGGVEIPADVERCARNDGKGWRCKKPKAEGYKMCFYHLPSSVKNKMNVPPKSEERNSGSKDIVYTITRGRKPRKQRKQEKEKEEVSGEESDEKAEKEVEEEDTKNLRKRGFKNAQKSGNLSENRERVVGTDEGIGKKRRRESVQKEREEGDVVGSHDVEDEEDEEEDKRKVSRKRKKRRARESAVEDCVEGSEDDQNEVGSDRSGGKKKKNKNKKKKREMEDTPGVRENGAEKKNEGGVAMERPRRSAYKNLHAGASNEDKRPKPRIHVRDENVMEIR